MCPGQNCPDVRQFSNKYRSLGMEGVAGGRQTERRRPAARVWLVGIAALLAIVWSEIAFSQESVFLPKIDVVAPSPLGGATARSRPAPSAPTRVTVPVPLAPEAGIDRDKIAA